jgi:hypothetical protein
MDGALSLELVKRQITLPLAHNKDWKPFQIDALGLVTLLGADEVNQSVGSLQHRRFTEYLPQLAAFVIAGDRFVADAPGFTLNNLSDGITSTELEGRFSKRLMSQDTEKATSDLERQKHEQNALLPTTSDMAGGFFKPTAALAHRSKAAPICEPEIPGFCNNTPVAFFPDTQSAHDIMSHDYAKRNHFKIDSSTAGKLLTAAGSLVKTLGTVTRPVRFAKESETYTQKFHVLPKCVHDIILGSPFLRMTQTFTDITKLRQRVVKKLRGLSSSHRVCFTGSSQEMLAGWANGQSVLALPDTGSDICLMSLQYAQKRGYHIDTDPRHRELLQLVDGSKAETFGRVEGFEWKFNRSDIQVHSPEIYVLENLPTDLLLSYGFLDDSEAFGTHQFIGPEPDDEMIDGWFACAIKLITPSRMLNYGRKATQKIGRIRQKGQSRFRSSMSSNPRLQSSCQPLPAQPPTKPDDLQQWHAREQQELSMFEKSYAAADDLSKPLKALALHDAQVRWDEFWAEWPGCGNTSDCSARKPCGHAGCNYTSPDTSTSEPSSPQAATGATYTNDSHPPDLAVAIPDPGPAPSIPAQTPTTIGTTLPSKVDPPDIPTNLALPGAAAAPQAVPQTSAERLTAWQMTSGLMGMFAKIKNETLTITALLCLLVLHFGGISLL